MSKYISQDSRPKHHSSNANIDNYNVTQLSSLRIRHRSTAGKNCVGPAYTTSLPVRRAGEIFLLIKCNQHDSHYLGLLIAYPGLNFLAFKQYQQQFIWLEVPNKILFLPNHFVFMCHFRFWLASVNIAKIK